MATATARCAACAPANALVAGSVTVGRGAVDHLCEEDAAGRGDGPISSPRPVAATRSAESRRRPRRRASTPATVESPARAAASREREAVVAHTHRDFAQHFLAVVDDEIAADERPVEAVVVHLDLELFLADVPGDVSVDVGRQHQHGRGVDERSGVDRVAADAGAARQARGECARDRTATHPSRRLRPRSPGRRPAASGPRSQGRSRRLATRPPRGGSGPTRRPECPNGRARRRARRRPGGCAHAGTPPPRARRPGRPRLGSPPARGPLGRPWRAATRPTASHSPLARAKATTSHQRYVWSPTLRTGRSRARRDDASPESSRAPSVRPSTGVLVPGVLPIPGIGRRGFRPGTRRRDRGGGG